MILRVERVSKKIMMASTFTVVKIANEDTIPFVLSFFSGYHRCGIKGYYKTNKYTEDNCKKVLNFVRR